MEKSRLVLASWYLFLTSHFVDKTVLKGLLLLVASGVLCLYGCSEVKSEPKKMAARGMQEDARPVGGRVFVVIGCQAEVLKVLRSEGYKPRATREGVEVVLDSYGIGRVAGMDCVRAVKGVSRL